MIASQAAIELPRERLFHLGAKSLTEAELLAVLVGRGGAAAVASTRRFLVDIGGFARLVDLPPSSLARIARSAAQRARVLAAAEIARRVAVGAPPLLPVEDPEQAARYVLQRYAASDQEVVGAIYVNGRNCAIGDAVLYRGTIQRVAAEPRLILREALVRGACGVVLFHTHPNQDPEPSAYDLLFTRRLAEAGGVLGVTLVDHLIVAAGGDWISLRQRGAW